MSENNKMPKLAPTDIVQLRDGRYGIVLMNDQASEELSVFVHHLNIQGITCIWHLDDYTENICKREHCSDIVKVWKTNVNMQFCLMNTFFYERRVPSFAKPDWVELPKKMTLKEIEQALGCSITIVEEHEEKEELPIL